MDHGIDMLAAWRAAQHVNPRAHRDVGPTAVVAAWVSVTPWVLWGDGGFPIYVLGRDVRYAIRSVLSNCVLRQPFVYYAIQFDRVCVLRIAYPL